MEEKAYCFSLTNEKTEFGIASALNECNIGGKIPLFICIGTDLVLGDSLGPLVGTMLKKKNISSYIYGTLNFPITAKEIEYVRTYVDGMHPNSIKIAIDASVGDEESVGTIKVINKGLKPGLGVNKKIETIGDISIVGIVATKTANNYDLYNLTRLNLIYKMADCISRGIENYINNYVENNSEYAQIIN